MYHAAGLRGSGSPRNNTRTNFQGFLTSGKGSGGVSGSEWLLEHVYGQGSGAPDGGYKASRPHGKVPGPQGKVQSEGLRGSEAGLRG